MGPGKHTAALVPAAVSVIQIVVVVVVVVSVTLLLPRGLREAAGAAAAPPGRKLRSAKLTELKLPGATTMSVLWLKLALRRCHWSSRPRRFSSRGPNQSCLALPTDFLGALSTCRARRGARTAARSAVCVGTQGVRPAAEKQQQQQPAAHSSRDGKFRAVLKWCRGASRSKKRGHKQWLSRSKPA